MTLRGMILVAMLAVGSTAFGDAAKVVGWRGDGTGRYPDATPPTTWSRTEKGDRKNIVWEALLPSYSWSMPIIVGEKIFVRSEPYDLICLNKKSGKILWIRSHPLFEAIPDEEKKKNPAYREIADLVKRLQEANDAIVREGKTDANYKRKWDLQKQIGDLTAKADAKYTLPPDMWQESWSGYTGQTPCSDGKYVYVACAGLTAAYDLDGKKKWATYVPLTKAMWGEHGHCGGSPGLAGDTLLVPWWLTSFKQYELLALNKATGAEIWRQTYLKGGTQFAAVLPFQAGGVDYAVAWKNFIRVSDGKSFHALNDLNFGAGGVIQGDVYCNLFLESAVSFWKFGARGKGDLQVTPLIKDEYANLKLPIDPPKTGAYVGANEVFIGSCATSPLYHDGLLYILTTCGRLAVVDTQKIHKKDGLLVYAMFPPFDFKNPPHRHTQGMGLCACPTLAGKYIYLMDNAGCTIVIEPGREYKQVAKNNINTIIAKGYEPHNFYGPRQEATFSTPIFEGSRMYIRGEQFLYCIGEK